MGFTVQYENGSERTFWSQDTANSEIERHGAVLMSSGDGDVDEVESSTKEPTKAELYEKAQELDIEGRTNMDKAELAAAIEAAEAAPDDDNDETPEIDPISGLPIEK